MKAELNQAYVNDGSEVTEIPAHSPGTSKSFHSNMQIYEEVNSKGVTSPAYIPTSTIGFLPDEVYESEMVTWHTRKMRQMTVFLVFFVVIALVMTGLFVWRTVFFDKRDSGISNCKDQICSTSEAITPKPIVCRQHAKPRPFENDQLPKKINDVLLWMKKELDTAKSSLANVIYMDKEIWSNFHGTIDPQMNNLRPIDRHSLFPVASLSKVFTSLMAFKMYENEVITTLDDRFIKYQPLFQTKTKKNSNKIVIRELLSNMAGLPREAPCFPDSKTNICPFNNSIILKRLKNLSLLWGPGIKPSYSNLGFGLLGNGLASSLNTTFRQWMKENLFTPLGMNDSTFESVSKNRDRIVIGNNGKRQEPLNWGWLDPAGGLFTSSDDLAKLEIELFKSLDRKGFLSPVYANEFFAPAYMLSDEKSLIGMPWEMPLKNGFLWRSKNGHIYGYNTNVFIIPELKLAFNVMFTLGRLDIKVMFDKLVNEFNSVLSENKTKIAVPSNPSSFTGIYKPKTDTSGAPGLSKAEVVYKNKEMKLIFTLYGRSTPFQLNYIYNTTFEIWDRPREACLDIFVRGFDMERVYFDEVKNDTNISHGFRVFGIHPRGWTYFERDTQVVN